jgi:hypothetical protein
MSGQTPGTLRDVTFSQAEGKVIFLVKVEGEFDYETSVLNMPRRLVIDLTPVGSIASPPYLQVNAGGVTAVRTGQYKPQTARIVFDLSDSDFIQSVSKSTGALIVSFRPGGGDPAVRPEERPAPGREIPRQEVRRTLEETVPAGESRLRFFLHAGGGLGLYLNPDLAVRREFALYGETGTIDEAYTIKSTMVFEGSLGRYLRFGSRRLKAGLGFSIWKIPMEGTFTLSLPHPFTANAPRTAGFAEATALEQSGFSVIAFALFPLVDTESFSVFLGPFAGYASGKILTLEDWSLYEKAPFTSADITVSDQTYFEDKIGDVLIGAALSLELRLSRSLNLVLDTKLGYLNPKVSNLGKRANLMTLQPTLGIQFSF